MEPTGPERYRRDMRGTLTFAPLDGVEPDTERPDVLRAPFRTSDEPGDTHPCTFIDLAVDPTAEPGLEAAGFETVDLSGNDALQAALRRTRAADHLDDADAAAIRSSLEGARLDLADDKSLRIDHVADDGMILRRSGPDGIDVNPGGMDGANGHGGARHVHGDQDVYGTPLKQMMHGAAPDLFRHQTPDGRNDTSDTFLLNLWIPLHAPVQPLALMDRRTFDAPRHQLRYGLPVTSFLDRPEGADVNDIWAILHDDAQQWYVRTDMGPDQGYVFDTLGEPHGAAVLDGEVALGTTFEILRNVLAALDAGDHDAARAATAGKVQVPPDGTGPTIQAAWDRMRTLVDEVGPTLDNAERGDHRTIEQWADQARHAVDGVIRRSIELRLVATLTTP